MGIRRGKICNTGFFFSLGATNELAQCSRAKKKIAAGKYAPRKEISVEMELETSGI